MSCSVGVHTAHMFLYLDVGETDKEVASSLHFFACGLCVWLLGLLFEGSLLLGISKRNLAVVISIATLLLSGLYGLLNIIKLWHVGEKKFKCC